jgi:hypothetical protein
MYQALSLTSLLSTVGPVGAAAVMPLMWPGRPALVGPESGVRSSAGARLPGATVRAAAAVLSPGRKPLVASVVRASTRLRRRPVWAPNIWGGGACGAGTARVQHAPRVPCARDAAVLVALTQRVWLQVTQLGHVKDLARAFTLCLGNKTARQQIYNISGARAHALAVAFPAPSLAHDVQRHACGRAMATTLSALHALD